jgi:hypothetical protein
MIGNRCIIIADTGKKKVILCIEMKAGKGGEMKDIIAQLQGVKCFVAYCREIGKSFWHHPNFLEDYNLRFISIKNITQQTNTRFDVNRIYPNQNLASKLKILHRSGKSFEFNDLVQYALGKTNINPAACMEKKFAENLILS